MMKPKWVLIGLVLLAFGLRAFRLDAQSLWSDEGLSLHRARLTVSENLTNVIVVPPGVPTQDTNPPLYFILLGVLCRVAGESEYALRFLSLAAGVALVPLLYSSGRRLFSERAGVLAATLGTSSSFLVWYAQEARMYTLLAALSLASVYALVRVLSVTPGNSNARGKTVYGWLAWVATTTAAVYTHFTAFFLVAFEGLVILGALVRLRRREAIVAVLTLIGVAIPIGLYGLSRATSGVDPYFGFRTLDSIAAELWSAFALGWAREMFQPLWAIALALVLFGVGGLAGFVEQPRRIPASAMVLANVFAVLLMFYAVTFVRPLYTGPRHLMLLAPPFYLLVGNGLDAVWRRRRWVGAAALAWIAGGMLLWTGVQFFDPAYLKDDMRSTARVVAEAAQPGDVVIVHDAISSFVFDYYYDGVAPWRIIPAYPSLDVDAALIEFQAQAAAAERVWFVTEPPPLHGFDRQALDVWARGHLLRLDAGRFPSIWLGSAYQLYTARFPILDVLPDEAEPREWAWMGGLSLVGIAQRDPSRLALFWRLDAPVQGNFVTTFRWTDAAGGERLRQAGRVFDNWSARRWPVGRIVRQDVTFDVPPDLPPGDYRVWVSVMDRESERRILLTNGWGEVDIASVVYGGR